MVGMSELRRATVYFETDLHRALKLKAAVSERSVSDMVNEAVRLVLSEDADDLDAFEDRDAEPAVDFDAFVKSLKARGKL